MKSVVLGAAVALVVAIVASPAWAQGGFGKTAKIQEEKQKASVANKDTAGKRDPVAEAFALPKGAALRAHQQESYNKMKQEMEPKLRDALSQVEAATGADKDKAARNVMTIRKEIRTKIAEILQKPDVAAIRLAQEAARAAMDARLQNRGQNRPQGRRRH